MTKATTRCPRPARRPVSALFRGVVSAVLALSLASSCSLMTDDRSDCPSCDNPLHVTFRYDYNMQRADMFNDHVQQLACYVVDAASNEVVATAQVANSAATQPLRSRDFAFNFEGLPAGDYRLLAIGRSPAADGGGAPVVPALHEAEPATALTIAMPHAGTPDAQGRYDVPAVQLDTLWHGLTPTAVHVEPTQAAEATVSLVRDTKNLSIMLSQTEQPGDNYADDYEVTVLDNTETLAYDNSLSAALPLTFRPYDQWTTETVNEADQVISRQAHYDLSLGRLLQHDDATRNARLVIARRTDGTPIVDLDLINMLAVARSASGRDYPVQEFLDRQYDYSLHFLLQGAQWRYLTITIEALRWTIRIQNEELN